MKVIDTSAYETFIEGVRDEIQTLNQELFEVLEDNPDFIMLVVYPYLVSQYFSGADIAETAQAVVERLGVTEVDESEFNPTMPEGVDFVEVTSPEQLIGELNRFFTEAGVVEQLPGPSSFELGEDDDETVH